MEQSSKRKAPTPGSWAPGTSGNPKGRPRSGLALAERIRDDVDPGEMVAIALKLLRDEQASSRDRIAVWTALAERGWIKPPAQIEIDAALTPVLTQTFDVSALPLDDQRRLLELVQRARTTRALAAGDDDK